jgi:cyclopropane fatty-acyl-phospholipid synthase-like methyltransferase
MAVTKAVLSAFKEFKKTASAGCHVLDFGAGAWLRYVEHLQKGLPSPNVYAVEFEEAFKDEAKERRDAHAQNTTLWTPAEFRKEDQRFDLIIAINVLNTIPEEIHQREIFKVLANRLNPTGKLFVYQRIWAKGESEGDGGIPYGEGWIMPQSHHPHHTYHGKLGANWFKTQAKECELRVVDLKTDITSGNTFFRAWERQFD